MATTRLLLRALLLVGALALAACSNDGPTLVDVVAADSPPTEAIQELPSGFDAPMPQRNASGTWSEYEDFLWADGVVDGYVMTYTQQCGDFYRADEPVTVWVEGNWTRLRLDDGQRSEDLVTIPELLEVVVARGSNQTLEAFVEGDLGQPELIVINNENGSQDFCFELMHFVGSTADGEDRMPVPLFGDARVENTEADTFSVGVPSCNGTPNYSVAETHETITVSATTWIPQGDDRDDCLDGIQVQLDAPIGNRTIIDGLSGLDVPWPTDEMLNQPQPLEQLDCYEDSPDCRANFGIDDQTYSITCIGVADEGVSPTHHASGVIDGGEVDAFQIKSVDVNIMLAVNVTSGECQDRAIGPIEGIEHAWSVAVRNGNDPDQLSRFLCTLADLSAEQRVEERCERFE